MLKYILQKMRNKKWMVICLLIGNLLMVAVAAANPMYSQAALQRTLTKDLGTYMVENSRFPGTIMVDYRDRTIQDNKAKETEAVIDEMVNELGVPVLSSAMIYSKPSTTMIPEMIIEGEREELSGSIVAYTDFADHITVTKGELFSDAEDSTVLEVMVNERTFVEQMLTVGEELTTRHLKNADGKPYTLRITGVFAAADEEDPYWRSDPSYISKTYFITENEFREHFVGNDRKSEFMASWHTVLDYTKFREADVERILDITEKYQTQFEEMGIKNSSAYYVKTMEAFAPKASKLDTTITVLQLPIFVLLAAFIFMVSRQMLENEQAEISIFKSRGASKRQIILMYLLQSVILAAVGVVGGIPLAMGICKVLGASNSFLEFVNRASAALELSGPVWLFAGGAALFSIATMVIPVFRFANVNIVAHKRRKNGGSKMPWWQKICLDLVLLAVSFYGLYQFDQQQQYLSMQAMDGASLDPLLYLCSSLFMLGAGLLILRILPWLIRLIFWIGKRWWNPAVYASFLRILRTRGNQGFLVVFLILTVAMGIFSTQTARTINASGEDRIRYTIGADVVLQEPWSDNASKVEQDPTGRLELTYYEPDFEKYTKMDGVKSATKVLTEHVTASTSAGSLDNVMLLGINTKEFGELAWFKDSLLPTHWYHYLNAMSQNSEAILVSSNCRDKYGAKIGDIVTYSCKDRDKVRGVIYGFVDYWPSYEPIITQKYSDGTFREYDNVLIVANLPQLQSVWGVTPYNVWIDTEGSSQFLYDYAEENQIRYKVFEDASADLVEMKNDPVFQGTNGILTIGFIIVLVLCATGFLIYWIMSIQSRTLQFGIFRAMGLSKREILSMLITEQIFISGTSILGGVLVGQIGAKLFVPLIQIAYSSADKVLPLEIVSQTNDYVRLGIVIGAMIVLCMAILGMLISKIKITQALKLGED